jgi:hypothetical protein
MQHKGAIRECDCFFVVLNDVVVGELGEIQRSAEGLLIDAEQFLTNQ